MRAHLTSRATALLLGSLMTLSAGLVAVPAATAGPTIPAIPKENAADGTPRVVDDGVVPQSGVRELQRVGTLMFAGGDFNTVVNARGTSSVKRRNVMSFDMTTNKVTSWRPKLTDREGEVNGATVYAMEKTGKGRFLFVGGDFRRWNGQLVNRLVKINLETREIDSRFTFPVANNRISDLQLVNGRLVVSGTFPGGIVAVDRITGQPTSYFDATQATGQEQGFPTRVFHFAVNPAGDRMAVVGSFQAVGGQPRQQAALLDLGPDAATLSDWSSPLFETDCSANWRWWARDVDWTPDGSRFVIVTAGGANGTLCDTASAWAPVDAAAQQPLWVNPSGGDTFHSVLATDKAIFVGGHFRWMDNPEGRDNAGPGAVSRRGLAALDVETGRALAWNPTKSIEQGRGAYDLLWTNRGLWVGHYERLISGERHDGLGLLPRR